MEENTQNQMQNQDAANMNQANSTPVANATAQPPVAPAPAAPAPAPQAAPVAPTAAVPAAAPTSVPQQQAAPVQPAAPQPASVAPVQQQPATPANVTPMPTVTPAPAPVSPTAPAAVNSAPEQQPATPANVTPMPAAPVANANAPEIATSPAAMQANKGTKILVVEDEIDARSMFVDLLNSEGYETSSAVDGVDALAKAAADKFHLILLDIVMPNKDGIEVLQEIKNNPDKYGTPTIVMLTNISGDAAIEKAMELGAAGFRLKVDVEPTQLLADVKDFLNGKVQNVEEEPVTRAAA